METTQITIVKPEPITTEIFVDFWGEINPDDFSASIQDFFGTNYSHVALRYADRDGSWRIFHATTPVVCNEPFEPFRQEHHLRHSFKLHFPCHPEYFWGFVDGADGKRYSMGQCFQMLIHGTRELNGNSELVCSELVGRKLVLHKILQLKGSPDTWTPVTIITALVSAGYPDLMLGVTP